MPRIFLVFVSLFIIYSNAKEKSDKEKCKICGYEGEDINYRIVNGDSIDPSKYPWLVSIAKEDDHEIFCTGALISSHYILTAAHCMQDHEKMTKGDCKDDICFRKAEKLEIGTWNEKSADKPSKTLKIGEVIPHPDFDGETEDGVLLHDIALLKLEEELSECDSKHGPICLKQKNGTGNDDELGMAGWGFSTTKGEDKQSEERELRKGTLKQLPSKNCTKSQKNSRVSETIICGVSSSEDDQIPCQGDSGSSIFKKVDGVYYSLGVGSTIMRDHDEKPCTLEGKVKYTKVSNHLKWIEEHVKELPKSEKDKK